MSALPEEGAPSPRRRRAPTATARFGSSRRESHDASAFYERFVAPDLSPDDDVRPSGEVDRLHVHDARDMSMVPSSSVALVVTSPPYFAGKAYEQDLAADGVPGSYLDYLTLLHDVFAECARVLEPGGRIAVNVANLGRRPYRSLSADVTGILGDLGLLLRGEVVWWKGRAAGGSCAWGTFQHPANPVLRDVTERIVIAGKGRFDRAVKPARRRVRGLPSVATVTRDEFLEATTDLWEIPPESATRVGHPAPFPVALPQRLIELYTYEGDVVLDPFVGSGSTAVAAVRTGRHYLGFDTDPAYVERAEARLSEERGQRRPEPGAGDPVREAVAAGHRAREVASVLLEHSGFTAIERDVRPRGLGIELALVATDARGRRWAFDVAGGLTVTGTGLRRAEALWKALATAAVLHEADPDLPLVLLATELPAPGTPAAKALAAVRGPGRPVHDAVALLERGATERLRALVAAR